MVIHPADHGPVNIVTAISGYHYSY